MQVSPAKLKRGTVTFERGDQDVFTVLDWVKHLLDQSGCRACGRVAVLELGFVVDPPEEIRRLNVVSLEQEGF